MAKFKKVLLVEDDPITVLVCDRILKISSFADTVISKTNGLEGINYLQHIVEVEGDLPEIIFLDINMPVMNGWDFLDEFDKMRTQFKIVPRIFILSSTVDPEDFKRAAQYDAVEKSISKPLVKENLDAIV